MDLPFGSIIKDKQQRYLVIGNVVSNNPQLILDNVNYIGKKNFVIHIRYGQGISHNAVLICKYSGKIPEYLKNDVPKDFEAAVRDDEIILVEPEEINQFKTEEPLEIDADEDVGFVASVRQNAILTIENYVDDLQKQINKLSQRKMNHYFSDKQHYEDVKDYLLVITPFSDLRLKSSQIRQDEWRLKLQLGGQ